MLCHTASACSHTLCLCSGNNTIEELVFRTYDLTVTSGPFRVNGNVSTLELADEDDDFTVGGLDEERDEERDWS